MYSAAAPSVVERPTYGSNYDYEAAFMERLRGGFDPQTEMGGGGGNGGFGGGGIGGGGGGDGGINDGQRQNNNNGDSRRMTYNDKFASMGDFSNAFL